MLNISIINKSNECCIPKCTLRSAIARSDMRFEQHLHTWTWAFWLPWYFSEICIVQAIAKKGFNWMTQILLKTLEGVVGQCNDLSADYNTLLTETNGLFTKVTAKLGCLLRDPDHSNRMHRYASMYGLEYVTNTLDIVRAIVRARFSLVFWWFLVNHPVTIAGPCRLLKINSI